MTVTFPIKLPKCAQKMRLFFYKKSLFVDIETPVMVKNFDRNCTLWKSDEFYVGLPGAVHTVNSHD